MNELILHIDNKNFRGFKTVAVSRGMEGGPWPFELTAAPGLNRNGYYDIQDGMSCQILIDDDLVLTGFIDDVDVDYDATTYNVSIRGRSKIADLVDCSTVGLQIKAGQNLVSIAVKICADYNINVTVHESARDAANMHFTSDKTQDAGQSPWEFLESLARERSALLISNAGGGMTITRAGSVQSSTALSLGKNIKASRGQRSSRSLFSEYHVIGQQASFGEASDSQSLSTLSVNDSTRYRPCLVQMNTPVDKAGCAAMADWQRRVNWGRSQSIVYTVSGWRRDNGLLWLPNEMLPINDARNQLYNAERLISEARLLLTDKGRETEITVMPKEAFDIQPITANSGAGFVP